MHVARRPPGSASHTDFSPKPIEWNDVDALYPETMALKKQNPNLKVLVAMGGWTMNEPWSP